MKKEHYLPYDYTRCEGTEKSVCSNCLRKLAPWNEYRQSVFLIPPVSESGVCEEKISFKEWKER